MTNNLECWQCGKTVHDPTRARFYFEDDSLLCDECFTFGDEIENFQRADPGIQNDMENQPAFQSKT